jgi:2-polyprenyl-6-methoxyphenol hydroxylase-like FAD-dependent oxidoreductase
MRVIETDMLIVGGGIAGSALACAVRDAGYRIVVVDQRREPLDTARGDHLQPCNVELLARWGVLEKFFARGAGRRVGHEFRTASGEALLATTYDELPVPYPYFLVFHHELIAELFLEIAADNPNFMRLQPVIARDFALSAEGISALKLELPEGGEAAIKPHLVVGADGTNSAVRAAMRFAADEHPYLHPMVAMFGPRPARLKPRDYFFRYSGRTGMLVIQQRMNSYIKVTLPVGAEGIGWWKRSTKEQRAEVLRQRAEVLKEYDSEIAGFYPVKMIHTRQYARGNVVLVGDAAHAIHPARGQGLNMGISSLSNLIRHLPSPKEISRPEKVRASLAQYQSVQKPLFDRLIARNHEAALAMDATAEGKVGEIIRQQDEHLRLIHRDPQLRRQHLLEATGYPFGLPEAGLSGEVARNDSTGGITK